MRTTLLSIIVLLTLSLNLQAQEKQVADILYDAIYAEEISGELDKAAELYNQVLKNHKEDRQACAQALFHLGLIGEKGKKGEMAKGHYKTLINSYAEIGEYARMARGRLQVIEDQNTFIDPRDGHKYKYVEIGDQTWMAENLAYMPWVNPPKKQEFGIWVYDYDGHDVAAAKATENYQKYGCLYDWTTAMDIDPKYLEQEWKGDYENQQGICPPGWHMPTDQEWMHLEVAAGYPKDEVANVDPYAFSVRMEPDKEDTGRRLKSRQGWQSGGNGTDSYQFSILPGGLRSTDIFSEKNFEKIGGISQFWTSTVLQDAYEDCPTDESFIRTLSNIGWYNNSGNMISKTTAKRSFGLSLRCVKNSSKTLTDYKSFVRESVGSMQGIPKDDNIVQLEPRIKKIYTSSESHLWILADLTERFVTYNPKLKKIICINKTSDSVEWESSFNLSNNHIAESNGKIFFSTGNEVVCLSSTDGTQLWTIDVKGMIEISIYNNILYGRKGYYSISVIDIETRKEVWNYNPESKFILSEPVVMNDILVSGKSFIGRGEKKDEQPIFYGLDLKSGKMIWSFSGFPGLTVSKPAVHQGVAYFNNKTDNYFYAINIHTGELLWRLYLDKLINSDIAFYGDKIICYESNHDYRPCDCYIISSKGELLKTIYLGDGKTNYKDVRIINNQLFIPSARYELPGDRIIVINLDSLNITHHLNLPIGPTSISDAYNGKLFFGAEDGIYVMNYPDFEN